MCWPVENAALMEASVVGAGETLGVRIHQKADGATAKVVPRWGAACCAPTLAERIDGGRGAATGRSKPRAYKGDCGYWFLMASPTLAGAAPVKVAVAESSSTSVTVAEPTLSVMDLMTLPVAGSFKTRTGRLTSRMSPTFTPAFLPTLRMSVLPLTSATRPLTSSLTVGTLVAEASS